MFLIDGSSSIDQDDWQLELNGYAAAVQSESFPLDGSVSVGVIQFSAGANGTGTRLEIPLTGLDSVSAQQNLVDQIRGIRQLGNSTNPGDALRAGTDHLLSNGRAPSSTEWNLCLSADGIRNSGEELGSAATYAQNQNVDQFSVIAIENGTDFTKQDAINHYGPHVFGGGRVTVARSVAEFATLVTGCLNETLRLRGLEVTQAVQSWENDVPLIQDKTTIVRAFLESSAGNKVRTSGRLSAYADGNLLAGSPLAPLNPASSITVDDNVLGERNSLSGSLNFRLPREWTTRSGDIEFRLTLPGGVVCPDENFTPNCGVEVRFEESGELKIHHVGTRWDDRSVTFDEKLEQFKRIRTQFPVGVMDYQYRFDDIKYDNRPSKSRVIADASALRVLQGNVSLQPSVHYQGLLPGFAPEDARTTGWGYRGTSVAWLGNTVEKFDQGFTRNRSVHEMGHSAGLGHVVSAAANGRTWYGAKKGWCDEKGLRAPDWEHTVIVRGEEYPALGSVGDPHTEIWGFDTRFIESGGNLAISAPRSIFPVMSYCTLREEPGQVRWMGERGYRKLHEGAFAPGADRVAPQGKPVESGLIVRGRVDLESGQVSWLPALSARQTNLTPSAEGSYELRVLDGSGSVLHSVRFAPTKFPGSTEAPPQEGMFTLVVPRDPAMQRLVLLKSGEQVGARSVSANAPSVTFTEPPQVVDGKLTASWTGSDSDDQPLRYTVAYSADGGQTWDNTIAVAQSMTDISVPIRNLSGSDNARLRVTVTDGMRSEAVVSETFTVPDNPPVLSIDSPPDGATYSGAQPVMLAATTINTDADGSPVVDENIVWRSNLDGKLGTGHRTMVRADQLSVGRHQITVTATDEQGNEATRSIDVTISRLPFPAAYSPQAEVTWGVADGRVQDIARVGDRVIIGGSFTSLVNSQTGETVEANRLAALDANTGELIRGWQPSASGQVNVLEVSADGSRLYVGGKFEEINESAREHIAALNPETGTLVQSWAPRVNGSVSALALADNRLYVGGGFSYVNGTPQQRLVALTTDTASVVDQWTAEADGFVLDIEPTAGGESLVVSGLFGTLSGESREYLGSVAAATGSATDWHPEPACINPDNPCAVFDLAVTAGRVYAAVGGPGGHLLAYSLDANQPVWSIEADGDVSAVDVHNGLVYAGGHYESSFGNATRHQLAAVDADTGRVHPGFAPQLTGVGGVRAVQAGTTHLRVGGSFTRVDGRRQPRYAQFPTAG